MRSRQRFSPSGRFKKAPGIETWVYGQPGITTVVRLYARFCSRGSVFDRNFSQPKTARGVCFRIAFREIPIKGKPSYKSSPSFVHLGWWLLTRRCCDCASWHLNTTYTAFNGICSLSVLTCLQTRIKKELRESFSILTTRCSMDMVKIEEANRMRIASK